MEDPAKAKAATSNGQEASATGPAADGKPNEPTTWADQVEEEAAAAGLEDQMKTLYQRA